MRQTLSGVKRLRVVRPAKSSGRRFRSSVGGWLCSRRLCSRRLCSRRCRAGFSSALTLLVSLAAVAPRDVRAQRIDRDSIEPIGLVEKTEKTPTAPASDDSVRGPEAALVIDPAALADNKRSKRAQAAHSLLKAIHTGQPSIADRHRKFLAEILSPEALRSGDVPWISATSIVQELQSWIPREGLPYPEVAANLLPLIGVGAPEFRKIVIQALNVLVTYEKEKGQSSPTLENLKTKLSQRVPTEGVLLDAAAVLWENDPRAALTGLVAALEIYRDLEADETIMWACLEALRTRISVYFPTPELWQNWWKRVENLPLQEMLVEYQRETVEDYTANWRRIMDRLKETQDAERVFSAIRDTLQRKSVELRLAAVNALGGYAQWVLEIPLRPEQSKDSKVPFLKRGAEALLGVIEREQFPLESPDVIQAALVSLRMYQNLSEIAPDAKSQNIPPTSASPITESSHPFR